jgi:hypothetical protein
VGLTVSDLQDPGDLEIVKIMIINESPIITVTVSTYGCIRSWFAPLSFLTAVDIMPIVDSPEFGHTFVPIDSLTSSPRSSTVSTSVLDWNSNSGSEGFSVRSLDHEQYVQSSPATPDIPTFSPNPPSATTSLPDDDQTFASFNSAAAPVADSVTDTVTSDTFAYHNLLSALDERLTLQDSVAQWQNHSYRETAGLDNRSGSPSDLLDDGVHDKPHISSLPSPNRSLATESSVSAVTVKPSLHVSSLFLPPSPPAPPAPCPPQVYSASPSVVSNQTQSESISIAQYFQRKAANAEEAVPVQPQVLRPISAASCLSYISNPVVIPLPDPSAVPLLTTWQDLISKAEKTSSSPTAYSPPTRPARCSSSWGIPSSRPRTSQMENNNPGSQFLPFIGSSKVTSHLSRGFDTQESNLKNHSPSKPAWPIPPVMFEPLTVKPIKPAVNLCPTNIHDRPQPCVKLSYGSLHGKIPGKSTNRPVPPSSRDQSSPYPFYNWQGLDLPHPSPWSNEARLGDIGQASPESIDSVLPPPPSTPSVSSHTHPGSPESPISAIPPSPPLVELQPPYLRHPTPSNVPPYIPPTPPAPLFNGAYSTTQRTSRALPIPSISRTFGSHTQAPPYTPRYTDSTLPRDMHLSAAPPTPWGPTPRRLRFAPLPPTPSAGLHYTGAPPPCSTQPYTTPLYTAPLPPYPLYPMPYPLHAQAPVPQTPAPISTPYSSWRPGPTNSSPLWTPHHVFWYSDGSIVFRVCHSFFVFLPLENAYNSFW